MKKQTTAKTTAKTKALPPRPKPPRLRKQRPIPASVLLRAEASRIEVLSHAMPEASQPLTESLAWAFETAAAFLDSLGAPEKLVRYVPATRIPAPPTPQP